MPVAKLTTATLAAGFRRLGWLNGFTMYNGPMGQIYCTFDSLRNVDLRAVFLSVK